MSLWLPGAVVVASDNDGGSMLGPAEERWATHHTYETGYSLSAVAGAKALRAAGNTVQVCWNPVIGDIASNLPSNRAARALRNESGGVQTNRRGVRNIQIETIARAANPWHKDLTTPGWNALKRLMAFLDANGVPRKTYGDPPGYAGPFPRPIPPGGTIGGHVGHSQWRENTHWDPGMVPWAVVFSALPIFVPPPPPPPAPKPPVPLYTRLHVEKIQWQMRTATDGIWGPETDRRVLNFRIAAYPLDRSFDVRLVQRILGVTVDGIWGPKSQAACISRTFGVQKSLMVPVDGDYGPMTDRAMLALRSKFKEQW